MKKKTPPKRKPVSKKLRFDVFKRDEFQCVYCGKSPPEVTLEIDHIDPVSKGGLNDINNLVSAYFECNRGKRNVRLAKKPNKTPENIAVLKEKEEQLKEYRKLIKRKTRRVDNDVKFINNIYSEAYPNFEFSDSFKTGSVKRFLEKLPREEIVEALNIAINRLPSDSERVIKYFCGVCWNKIKADDPECLIKRKWKELSKHYQKGVGYLKETDIKAIKDMPINTIEEYMHLTFAEKRSSYWKHFISLCL